MSNSIPSHLTGELKNLWEEVYLQTNGNPEAEVEYLNDPAKKDALQALSNMGGCTITEVENGVKVKLMFEPEAVEEVLPEEKAVAKAHKFAIEE